MNLTEDMLVDDVASTKHPPLSPQSFSGSKTPGWPDRPLSLAQTHRVISLSIALDSVLLIVALLFLALAAGAVAVSGRRVGDKNGELIESREPRDWDQMCSLLSSQPWSVEPLKPSAGSKARKGSILGR